MIEKYFKKGWYCLATEEAQTNPIIRSNIKGKYLFFSPSYHYLIKIATQEIENYSFHVSKVSSPDIKTGNEYVLCLYWSDDSRVEELKNRYADEHMLVFAGWKSDEDTFNKVYSDKFLKNKLNK